MYFRYTGLASEVNPMSNTPPQEQIVGIYSTLLQLWGRQHWWPAASRFEVIVGAYLTQNTSWSNVEMAMKNLRSAHRLTVHGIRDIPLHRLEQLIRSSGYFRQKARCLKTFVNFLDRNYGGSLTKMFAQTVRRPASDFCDRRLYQENRRSPPDCRADGQLRGTARTI